MSEHTGNPEIRVINEEYERVLSNPDNIIVSEELQQLIDLPMEPSEEVYPYDEEAPLDTAAVTILNSEGMPMSVRGALGELSYSGEAYTITIQAEKVRQGFLEALDTNVRNSQDIQLIVDGVYESDMTARIYKWAVKSVAPHVQEFTLHFRSKDGIF